MNIGIGLISFNHIFLNKNCVNLLRFRAEQATKLPNGKYQYEHKSDYKINHKVL